MIGNGRNQEHENMPEIEPKKMGRPTEFTDEVRLKIEEVASLGGSVEEMAYYSGAGKTTIYRWLKEKEDFRNRIEELQQHTILKARQTVVKALDNPEMVFKYLERKRPKEFGSSQKIEHTGTMQLQHGKMDPSFKKAADELKSEFNAKFRALYEGPEETNEPNEQEYGNQDSAGSDIERRENISVQGDERPADGNTGG